MISLQDGDEVELARLRRRLDEAEALILRQRMLIDNSQAALWVFDVDAFAMVDSNANTAALVKLPLERFIGANPVELSPPTQPNGLSTLEHATQLIGRALQGETVVAPWTFRASDGTLVPAEIRAALLPMPGRRLICGSTIDVTERTRAAQELEHRHRFESLVARLSTHISTLDPEALDPGVVHALGEIGTFADMDRAYVYLFGHGGATISCTHEWCKAGIAPMGARMIGMPCPEYSWTLDRIRQNQTVHVPSVAALPASAASVRRECEAVGTQAFVAVPMRDGTQTLGLVGFASLHNDKHWDPEYISLLRTFGEMLVGALQRKQALVARQRQTEELRRSNAELTRSNTELQHFAYVASHDLQEPLRSISSFSHLLTRRYRGKLDADADTYLGFLHSAATQMQALVKGLLDYSRVGHQANPFRACNMSEVLELALANLDASIQEQQAVITHGELPDVLGDPGQLVQLLQNLVGNAIKFRGEAAPRIHIEATHSRRAGDGYVFIVSDNGIGISGEHASQLFQLFKRLHTQDRYPGTGIGLALCKAIVERHRGRMWTESNAGGGSRFCFTLPAIETAAAA